MVGLATGALCGCGGAADHSLDIVYDPCRPVVIVPGDDTVEPQQAGIRVAISLWKEVGVGALTLDPAGGVQRLPVYFRDAPAAFRGIYEPSNGEVRVNSKVVDRALEITLAHELGHALGLPHVPAAERASVMNPSNAALPPNAEDRRLLRDRWSCLPAP